VARIVVTRPVGREREWLGALREAGHDALHVPLIAVEPLGDGPVDVEPYDWVVLTSVVGARELRRRMRGSPRHVAAVGPATAEAFGGADVVAAHSTQEGLLAALPDDPGRVLFAGAEAARRLLPEALGADVVVLYRTVPLVPPAWPPCDLVVLASASAGRAYAALGQATPVVSIGRETSRAAAAAGVAVAAEAQTTDVAGLLDAVRRALSTS
jgi:uroporphyrinogen-III synthase